MLPTLSRVFGQVSVATKDNPVTVLTVNLMLYFRILPNFLIITLDHPFAIVVLIITHLRNGALNDLQ